MLSAPYSGQYTGTARFPLHTLQHHTVANILGQPDAHLAMLSAPYSGQYTGTARFPLHTWQCYQHHIVANILGQPDSPCTPSSVISTIQWPIYWDSQIPLAHLAVLSAPYSGTPQHHTVANILGQPDSPCTPSNVISTIQWWPIYWDSQIPLAHLAMLSAPYRFPLHT